HKATLMNLLSGESYSKNTCNINTKLDRIISSPDDFGLIALQRHKAIGFFHLRTTRLIASDGYTEAFSLALPCDAIELYSDFCLECSKLSIQSGNNRFRVRVNGNEVKKQSALFNLGFEKKSAAYIFEKQIRHEKIPVLSFNKFQLKIRPAHSDDSEQIAKLLPSLGYTASANDISGRLTCMNKYNHVFVADFNGLLVGLYQAEEIKTLLNNSYIEIHALVVDEKIQNKGIGKALISHVITLAHENGYSSIRLGSGIHRTNAHRFYSDHGFSHSGLTYAYERKLLY
ncbi:MAG: GNAT family N-acetyltransferase, partial [Iodobacter sp.]